MTTLPFCLGLVKASEQELVNALGLLADRHSRDFEIYEGCKLFAQWSRAHLETLDLFIKRYGRAVNSDPTRVRSALFHGMRVGGYGLMRDMQDLLLLVHQARTAWTSLDQAAKEMKDTEMDAAALRCAGETDRQIDWVCAHIKLAAPQALTVPVDLGEELNGSLPKKLTPASLPEVTWAPIAGGAAILGVGAISLLAGQPWLLPSLGPTAYLLAELPEHPSARFYNTVVGHVIGLLAGFLAVALFNAWDSPSVLTDHFLTSSRLGAAAVAVALTLFITQLLKSNHPPAAATTLLVALGSLKTIGDARNLAIGALLIGIIGVVLRRVRTKVATPLAKEHSAEVLSAMPTARPKPA